MTDIVSQTKRSEMMAGIRGKNTKPEILVRQGLHALGYRFRLHRKDLPGRPDIVLSKYKAVVFVNGCFWHGHGCHLFKWPKTREEFWREKIGRNIVRDNEKTTELLKTGWRVFTVWECSIRGQRGSPKLVLDQISTFLQSIEAIGATDAFGAIQSR